MGFFLTLIFTLSPLLTLPFILYYIRRRKIWAVWLFASFLGIVAYCTIPSQDLFRHLMHYETYSNYKWKDFTYFDFELNGIIVFIYCLMGKLGIPFDFLRFITISTSYLMIYQIFKYKINQINYTNREYFTRFLIFTLFYDLFYTIAGVRYGFALCIYIYGLYFYIEKRSYIKSILLFIIAGLFHSSFLFLIPAAFVIYILKVSKRSLLIIAIIAFVAMTIFFAKYSYLLGVRENWYGNGSSVSSYSSMTTYGFLGFFLPKLCVVPFVVLLIKKYDKTSKWMRFTMAWFIISIINLQNAVFFYRFWWVVMALGIYIYIDVEKKNGKDNLMAKKFLRYAILFALFSLIPVKSFLENSNYERLFEPIPLIFSEQYNVQDILERIPNAGDFYTN